MLFLDKNHDYDPNQAQQYELYLKIYGTQVNKLFEERIKEELHMEEIHYTMLRDYFKYDKRIRRIINKYIEMYEESLKGIIYDNTVFVENEFIIKKPGTDFSSIWEINRKERNYYSMGRLREILLSLKLINQSKALEIEDVIDLRNNIAHYNLLVLDLSEIKIILEGFFNAFPKQVVSQIKNNINMCKNGLEDLHDLYLSNY